MTIKIYTKRFLYFWVWVFKEYLQQNCFAKASALALTSLFALVPLLMVSISILSMLPAFQSLQGQFQNFIFENMLPSSGSAINEYLQMFLKNRVGLPVTAVVVLFVISVMMMRSLEKVLNEIWQVQQERPLTQALLLYWAVLSLGPILVGTSLTVSSYLLSLKWWGVNESLGFNLLSLLPFLFNFIAFTFIYLVVPNTKVKLGHAIIGGVMMAVVFDLTKKAFAWYALHPPTYEMLYGTLAIIPLFILWVALSWQLFLLGAVIVHALGLSHQQRQIGESTTFELSLMVLKILLVAQVDKKGMNAMAISKKLGQKNIKTIQQLLSRFAKKNYVVQSAQNKYYLACDLNSVMLSELYQDMRIYFALDAADTNDYLKQIKKEISDQLNVSIASVF